MESGIPSFRMQRERNFLISRGKVLILDEAHPRRCTYANSVSKRLDMKNYTSHSWHSITNKLSTKYHLEIVEW